MLRTSKFAAALVVGLLTALASSALAATAVIEADRDATLIEHPDGALASGIGPLVFAGRTGQPRGSIRRAAVHFDVAAALPAGARIDAVRLVFHVDRLNPGAHQVRLHRLQADWGEGASSGMGGKGVPAAPGDATWVHTFYDLERWVRPGGHFLGRPSARAEVAGTGDVLWGGARMVNDVRLWLSAPHRNFGWVLLGDETGSNTAIGFDSRESMLPDRRPRLEVDYRPGKGRGRHR